MRTWRVGLIAETVLTFLLPAYFWLWGALTAPLWILGAVREDVPAAINLLCVVGGLLGAIGITSLLRQIISMQPPTRRQFKVAASLSVFGLVAVWTMMTGHFQGFELNWFTVIAIIAPTLCTAHLLTIGWKRLVQHERQGSDG